MLGKNLPAGKCLNLYYRDLLSAFGLGAKKINNILNQEDQPGSASRLEQLLSDEETISECKGQNQKLIEFLGKKENLK